MNKPRILTSLLAIVILASIIASSIPLSEAQTTHSVTFAETEGGDIFVRLINNPLVKLGEGTYNLDDGEPIRIYTLASPGYMFTYFSFTGISTGNTTVNPLETTVLSDFTITAHFAPIGEIFYYVNFIRSYGGVINVNYNGFVFGAEGEISFPEGAYFTIHAQPTLGYQFDRITLNQTNVITDPIYELSITGNSTIQVNFSPDYYSGDIFEVDCQVYALTNPNDNPLTGAISTGGNITFMYNARGDGITNTGPYAGGTYTLLAESILSFSNKPDPGYKFLYFLVNQSQIRYENSFDLVITGPTSVYAVFVLVESTWNFDWDSFQTSLNSILLMVVACVLVFGGIAILMKAPNAWLLGVLLVVAGFAANLVAQTNLIGLLAFAIEIIIFMVFLYSGSGKQTK